MVVSVRGNDFFIAAHAETMGRLELSLKLSKCSKLAADLHLSVFSRSHKIIARHNNVVVRSIRNWRLGWARPRLMLNQSTTCPSTDVVQRWQCHQIGQSLLGVERDHGLLDLWFESRFDLACFDTGTSDVEAKHHLTQSIFVGGVLILILKCVKRLYFATYYKISKTYESMGWQWIGGRHFHRLVKTRGSGWACGWWSSRLGPTFTNDRIKGRSFGHFDVLFVKIFQERQRWPVFIVKMPIRFVFGLLVVQRVGGSRRGWSCHFFPSFPNFLTAFLVGDPSLSKFPACLGLRESQLRAWMTGTKSSLQVENNSISSLQNNFFLLLPNSIVIFSKN